MSPLASLDDPSLAPASRETEAGRGGVNGLRAVLPLAVGLLVTMVPVTLLVPVLKELVGLRYDLTPFWTHTFMSVNLIGAIVFAPLGGMLADRIRSPRLMIVGALLIDALCLFGMRSAASFAVLMALRFVEGAAHVQAVSMWMAAAAGAGARERSGGTMGAMGAALMLGTAVGAPLGGLIGRADPLAVLTVGPIISVLGAAIAVLWMPASRNPARVRGLGEALAIVRRDRWLLVPYVYTFIDRLCVGVVISTLILYLAEAKGLGPATRGGMMTLFLLPLAFLCYPAGLVADRIGRAVPLAVGSVLFGVVFASYGLLSSEALWIAMVLSGVFSALMFAPSLALCRDLAPEKLRTTAFAGFNAAGSLGFLCGPLLGGTMARLLAAALGVQGAYQATFLVAGAAEVLCAIVSIPFLVRLVKLHKTA